ncbi:MAG: MlrC C-terminal domain-containing protein [Pyrinomonadaceae bacterium]
MVTDNDPDLAEKCAKEIANRFSDLEEKFVPHLPGISEAVRDAIESDLHPVILADIGDNIGAGTTGDSTFILEELIAQSAGSGVVIIADPKAAIQATEAGIGNTVMLSIGGKTDSYHGKPLTLECEVKNITDGVFTNRGQMRDGIIENMGRTAVVESEGIKIVLTEFKMPPWNLQQLRSVGIEPEKEKIIALKSAVAFRAAYEPIAGKIIEVNTPGLSSIDLSQFDFKNIGGRLRAGSAGP